MSQESFGFIEKSMQELTSDYIEKENEKSQLKQFQVNSKNDYNNSIRIYNSNTNEIIEIEKNINDTEREISKIKKKRKMILFQLNDDFLRHFMENILMQTIEIREFILHFIGLSVTSYNTIKKIKINERDFAELLKDSEQTLKNEESAKALKQTFKRVFSESSNLAFPFNILKEYFNDQFELIELEKKQELLEETYREKVEIHHQIFLQLKSLELEIFKNDSILNNISKYLNSIKSIIDKYLKVSTMKDENERNKYLNHIKDSLRSFKRVSFSKILRKFETSLTIKSEFSENDRDISANSEISNNIVKESPLKISNLKTQIHTNLEKLRNDDNNTKSFKKIKTKNLFINSENPEMLKNQNILKSKNSNNAVGSNKNKEFNNMKMHMPLNSIKIGENNTKNIAESISPTKNLAESDKLIMFRKSESIIKQESIMKQTFQKLIDQENDLTTEEKLRENDLKKVKTDSSMLRQTKNLESGKKEVLQLSETMKKKIFFENQSTKIPTSNSFLNNYLSPTNGLINSVNIDNDNVNDEWMISAIHKMPTRGSKMISEKSIRKPHRSLDNTNNLRIDKNDIKTSGCCASCF